jgi:hypothetical protein
MDNLLVRSTGTVHKSSDDTYRFALCTPVGVNHYHAGFTHYSRTNANVTCKKCLKKLAKSA